MADKLKQHLTQKTDADTSLKILRSQWDFDEELIPKALQNISSIFPHYTRHDVSHSRQILINIERLLGDSIAKLSATDTWLILEAAYWHDIGMVISAQDIKEAIGTKDFIQFVQSLSINKTHELSSFAVKYLEYREITSPKATLTMHEVYDNFRMLLAEWFRSKHASRADMIVGNPFEKLGINSPRTELLPNRLFSILGKICMSHGLGFDDILDILPFSEVGVGTEDCHPRFVAFLLRLGDLLDIDNNRFCPVMLRMISSIPLSSQHHIEKHLSIKNFRFDRDKIEIYATCKDYDSYDITDKWFGWIRDEVSRQMSMWGEIVPNRDFGLLPTLGSLNVSLESDQELMHKGRIPRFGIDTHQAMNLLQGAGLYNSQWECIRELLQNAVDSTMLKIWLLYKEKIDFTRPNDEIYELFAAYPINVSVEKIKDNDDKTAEWEIKISDMGIGISKEDLGFMEKIGSSYKNLKKRSIIEKMPPWMRPSGAFGIGLQSVFLITDKIEFKTKSMFDGRGLIVTMHSPLKKHDGLIEVKKDAAEAWGESGATLSFQITSDTKVEDLHYSKYGDGVFNEYLSSFDPIVNDAISHQVLTIVDQINDFGRYSPVPVSLKSSEFSIKNIKPDTAGVQLCINSDCSVALIALKYVEESTPPFRLRHAIILFKGQHIEAAHIAITFVKPVLNIIGKDASDVLTINRDSIRSERRSEIVQTMVDTIAEYINLPDRQERNDIMESAFMFVYKKSMTNKALERAWTKLQISAFDDKTLDEICSLDNFTLIHRYYAEHKASLGKNEFVLSEFLTRYVWNELLLFLWKEKGGYVQLTSRYEEVVFSKHGIEPLSEEAFFAILTGSNRHIYTKVETRFYYPAIQERYRSLAVKQNLSLTRQISDVHKAYDQFIFPYFFNGKQYVLQNMEELYSWTVENNLNNPKPTIEAVKAVYEEFIESIRDIMHEANEVLAKGGVDD